MRTGNHDGIRTQGSGSSVYKFIRSIDAGRSRDLSVKNVLRRHHKCLRTAACHEIKMIDVLLLRHGLYCNVDLINVFLFHKLSPPLSLFFISCYITLYVLL